MQDQSRAGLFLSCAASRLVMDCGGINYFLFVTAGQEQPTLAWKKSCITPCLCFKGDQCQTFNTLIQVLPMRVLESHMVRCGQLWKFQGFLFSLTGNQHQAFRVGREQRPIDSISMTLCHTQNVCSLVQIWKFASCLQLNLYNKCSLSSPFLYSCCVIKKLK